MIQKTKKFPEGLFFSPSVRTSYYLKDTMLVECYGDSTSSIDGEICLYFIGDNVYFDFSKGHYYAFEQFTVAKAILTGRVS